MKKLNVYLTDSIYEDLRTEAHKNCKSMSEMIRSALLHLLKSSQKAEKIDYRSDPFNKLLGKASFGPSDISENHDKYLYGWSKD